jgi:hypothetical protein
MKMLRIHLVALFLAALLLGCTRTSPPAGSSDNIPKKSDPPVKSDPIQALRVDASSDEALSKSLKKIADTMSDEEGKQFGADCMELVLPDAMKATLKSAFGKEKVDAPRGAQIFKPLHGMTVEEIRAKAKQSRTKSGNKQESDTPLFKQEEAQDSSPKKVAELAWTSSDKPVQLGEVEVHLTGASVGRVRLQGGFEGQTKSKELLLMIRVKLVNRSETKKVEYKGWGSDSFGGWGKGYPTLRDNFENKYNRAVFGLSSRPVGATSYVSIYPDKEVADVLVFEPPVTKASHLYLELPAEAYGGKGTIRFRIPTAAVSHDSD